MSESIALSCATEINRLHSEICEAARTSIDKAIRIGELLSAQKASLKHGEWLPWLKDNVLFTDRTARNYLRVFENRLRLKSETISDLSDAYNALIKHLPTDPDRWPQISIKHLGVFVKAFSCTQLDWGAFDLLQIPIREGRQAVEVYFDESDREHVVTFWFYLSVSKKRSGCLGICFKRFETLPVELWQAIGVALGRAVDTEVAS